MVSKEQYDAAKLILDECEEYMNLMFADGMRLDGDFSVEELEAIVTIKRYEAEHPTEDMYRRSGFG